MDGFRYLLQHVVLKELWGKSLKWHIRYAVHSDICGRFTSQNSTTETEYDNECPVKATCKHLAHTNRAFLKGPSCHFQNKLIHSFSHSCFAYNNLIIPFFLKMYNITSLRGLCTYKTICHIQHMHQCFKPHLSNTYCSMMLKMIWNCAFCICFQGSEIALHW